MYAQWDGFNLSERFLKANILDHKFLGIN